VQTVKLYEVTGSQVKAVTVNDVEKLEAAQRDADRAYNDALTALDRAIVAVGGHASVSPGEYAELATRLIVFLQQITPFVESKDRRAAAIAAARSDQLQATVESLAELRTQVGVLQRGMQMLTRERADPTGRAASPSAGRSSSAGDFKYVGFEDQFRGSDEVVLERVRGYVPIFAGASDVLDIGCGRGEFLAALDAAGVASRGVDANGEMVAVAVERGLSALQADALAYVESLDDASLGGAIATQVVEHLEPGYLLRLLDALSHKLRQGAPVVIETINPACWLAFFSSYIRDFTHVRPVHPETLQYLLRASGFERVEIRYSAPVPEHMKMRAVDLPAEILGSTERSAAALVGVAHTVNANAAILNNLMFTHLDYAAIGRRS
jgi:SAM-dependent methyltransferase